MRTNSNPLPPPHTETHTCKLFKAPDGDREHPTVSGTKNSKVTKSKYCLCFFFFQINQRNVLLSEKSRSLDSTNRCVSASMCSAVAFHSSSPCQCELAPDAATAKVSLCVDVYVCKATTVICIMGFVVPKADED